MSASLDRAVLDVSFPEGKFVVIVECHAGHFVAHCTCGATACAHSAYALAVLERAPKSDGAAAGATTNHPPRRDGPRDGETSRRAVASALEDLVVAVVRAGSRSVGSPAIDDAMKRAAASGGARPTLAMQRFLGRLRAALHEGDVDGVAHLLDGVERVVGALRSGVDELRAAPWIAGEVTSVAEARQAEGDLVEIGRERLSGLERGAIERRYLLALATGVVHREEAADGFNASAGPCPRTIHVRLAEHQAGPAPIALRVLQYAVTPELDRAAIAEAFERAEESPHVARERALSLLFDYPCVAEPVAVLRFPLESSDLPLLRDGARGRLAESSAQGAAKAWVFGRVLVRRGSVAIAPVAVLRVDGHDVRHIRIA